MPDSPENQNPKKDIRLIDVLEKQVRGENASHLSKPKLILLDGVILVARFIRIALILAQMLVALGCLLSVVCYIAGINPNNWLPFLPYLPGLALSVSLLLAAIYFGFSGLDEIQREKRLIRAYLKWHSFEWQGREVEYAVEDDDAPIGQTDPRHGAFAQKAGRLFWLTLPVVGLFLFSSAGWRLPWEEWGWFR
jgi:hypothetical protein